MVCGTKGGSGRAAGDRHPSRGPGGGEPRINRRGTRSSTWFDGVSCGAAGDHTLSYPHLTVPVRMRRPDTFKVVMFWNEMGRMRRPPCVSTGAGVAMRCSLSRDSSETGGDNRHPRSSDTSAFVDGVPGTALFGGGLCSEHRVRQSGWNPANKQKSTFHSMGKKNTHSGGGETRCFEFCCFAQTPGTNPRAPRHTSRRSPAHCRRDAGRGRPGARGTSPTRHCPPPGPAAP